MSSTARPPVPDHKYTGAMGRQQRVECGTIGDQGYGGWVESHNPRDEKGMT
jgi:hypothetical protein